MLLQPQRKMLLGLLWWHHSGWCSDLCEWHPFSVQWKEGRYSQFIGTPIGTVFEAAKKGSHIVIKPEK